MFAVVASVADVVDSIDVLASIEFPSSIIEL